MISPWVNFPFPRPINKYIILMLNIYNSIKLKSFIKGPIVVEKLELEVDPFFCHFRDNLFSFVDPRLMMPTVKSKKVGIPYDGT